jgi:3-oxoacyl-(acyl-carrier-protein) synthase
VERKVVVTGMGTVNPLALTVEETWERAVAGRSGVAPITLFDASDLGARIAAEVKNFDPTQFRSAAGLAATASNCLPRRRSTKR